MLVSGLYCSYSGNGSRVMRNSMYRPSVLLGQSRQYVPLVGVIGTILHEDDAEGRRHYP